MKENESTVVGGAGRPAGMTSGVRVRANPSPALLTRRSFLQAVMGWPLLGSAAVDGARRVPASGFIDTHTHFYDPTRSEGVPWPPRTDKLLYRRVLPTDLKAIARPLGVAGTVVVEASERLEDNAWLLDLAARDRYLLGIVGFLEPGVAGFGKRLERLALDPLFRGIRIGTWGGLPDLRAPRVLEDLRRVADLGLCVDVLCRTDRLVEVARLARKLPRLRLVIDHVANVSIDGSEPPRAWMEGMRAVSESPSAFCKLSGLVEGTGKRNGDAPTEVAFYRPILDAVWRYYGEDRLVWASNWPVSERFGSYATTLRLARDYVRQEDSRAVDKVLRRNAIVAYGLEAV